MHNDAQLARDMAKVRVHHSVFMLEESAVCHSQLELARQEQSMAESRREREKVLAEYRRQAEEKKDFKEKVERRVSQCLILMIYHPLTSTPAEEVIHSPLCWPE